MPAGRPSLKRTCSSRAVSPPIPSCPRCSFTSWDTGGSVANGVFGEVRNQTAVLANNASACSIRRRVRASFPDFICLRQSGTVAELLVLGPGGLEDDVATLENAERGVQLAQLVVLSGGGSDSGSTSRRHEVGDRTPFDRVMSAPRRIAHLEAVRLPVRGCGRQT